mmetsp:Transcript_34198/g.66606  ORF Transcript_34198/g.66606 Transcript_34198/m.66606 type:complete len:331 (-) Transcript_34198:170-1162(-)
MQAVVCRRWGPPSSLTVERVPNPKPKKGQVVVDVKACSVNFPDMLLVAGKYQAKPKFPFTPGSDVAGVISSVGPGVHHLQVGQRVMAFVPLGGFAERVACPAKNVIPIPPEMDFKVAAASSMVYGTSYYALKQRAKLKKGETLLVLGASGGCGMAAVQLGKAMGARVIAAASTAEKLEVAKKNGADEVINYTQQDLRKAIKALTKKKGVDVVFDPVGGAFAEPALRCVGWGGRFLVIGFAAGRIPKIPLNLPLLKSSAVVGVFWGAWVQRCPMEAMENMMEISTMIQEGTIKPLISKVYPLAQTWKALDDLAHRKVIGKVVVCPEIKSKL